MGACAGSTAAIFTTPFDLVKTRLQTESAYLAANPAAASGGVRYRGVAHVLSTIVREEGIRGLYRGIGPRLVIYCSQGAIFFGCYELCKALFEANAAKTPDAVAASFDGRRMTYRELDRLSAGAAAIPAWRASRATVRDALRV